MFLPEDVTHSAAGEDLQTAATLPHSERDLCTHTHTQMTLLISCIFIPEAILTVSYCAASCSCILAQLQRGLGYSCVGLNLAIEVQEVPIYILDIHLSIHFLHQHILFRFAGRWTFSRVFSQGIYQEICCINCQRRFPMPCHFYNIYFNNMEDQSKHSKASFRLDLFL